MVKDARPLEDVMVGDTVDGEAMAGEGGSDTLRPEAEWLEMQ